MCSRFLCQRRSSIGIVIQYLDGTYCMPCTHITDMYAKKPLKVYGRFHVFSCGCMIDRCLCPRSAAVSWMSSASIHGVHDWFMHAIHAWYIITKMSCDAMMDCAVPSTWYEAKQSCQKVAKARHPIEQVLTLRTFADFCVCFAEICARFARPPFHFFQFHARELQVSNVQPSSTRSWWFSYTYRRTIEL